MLLAVALVLVGVFTDILEWIGGERGEEEEGNNERGLAAVWV